MKGPRPVFGGEDIGMEVLFERPTNREPTDLRPEDSLSIPPTHGGAGKIRGRSVFYRIY